jgi:hypothetical protein
MKTQTMLQLALSIQLLQLDGYDDFTYAQLSSVSGVSTKTIQRNAVLIQILDFALHRKEYHQCIAHI